MKRVLLTGATGFIGQNFREFLSDGEVELICPIRGASRPVTMGRYTVIPCDLTDPGSSWSLPEVDVVINCASEAQVADAISSPVGHLARNGALMTNLLEYARRIKPKVVIHLSTNEVNSIVTPYGASKAAQEAVCRAYSAAYAVPVAVVTTASVFGPHQQRTKFIPTVVRRLLADEPIDFMGGLNVVRPWHFVGDLIHDVNLLVERALDGNELGFQYKSVSGSRTNLSVMQLIEKRLERQALIRIIDGGKRYAAGAPVIPRGIPDIYLGERPYFEDVMADTVDRIIAG